MKIYNKNKKMYMLLFFAMIVVLLVFKIIYIPNRGDVGEITCSVNLACLTYYIYAYHDFGEKLRCS